MKERNEIRIHSELEIMKNKIRNLFQTSKNVRLLRNISEFRKKKKLCKIPFSNI